MIVVKSPTPDPYEYRVEMDPKTYVAIMPWIKETGFKCSIWNDIISTVVYIKNEQDLTFFLLRWS
jgi:hypothetical protein